MTPIVAGVEEFADAHAGEAGSEEDPEVLVDDHVGVAATAVGVQACARDLPEAVVDGTDPVALLLGLGKSEDDSRLRVGGGANE